MPVAGLRGMIAAVQVYRQLADQQAQQQQQAMQREQFNLQKQEATEAKSDRERRRQIEDIRNIEFLAQHGRALSPGNLIEQQGEAALPQIPGQPSSVPFSFTRPANPDRVREYKASDGTKFGVELYTPKEREKLALDQYKQQKAAESQAFLERFQQEQLIRSAIKEEEQQRNSFPISEEIARVTGLPVGFMAPKSAVGALISSRSAADRVAMQTNSQEERAAADREAAAARAEQANATRLQAAGISAAGADRRANTAADRVAQKRVESLQAQHDTLQQQEQAAWAEYRSASAAMSEAQKEIADNKLKTDDKGYGQAKAREAKARQAAEKAKAMAESLLSQKLQVLKRKDALLGQDEAGKVQQKAAPAGAAPKKDPLGIL